MKTDTKIRLLNIGGLLAAGAGIYIAKSNKYSWPKTLGLAILLASPFIAGAVLSIKEEK